MSKAFRNTSHSLPAARRHLLSGRPEVTIGFASRIETTTFLSGSSIDSTAMDCERRLPGAVATVRKSS
jgi:hypothetical protein